MRHSSLRAAAPVRALLAGAVAATLLAVPAGAAATRTFRPCGLGGRLTCAVIRSPLDASGRVPGRVALQVLRYEPNRNASAGTIIAFAGGPGQSAIGAFPVFLRVLAPVLRDRALVVFDERGIGLSDPLVCSVLASLKSCVAQLGARRAFYSTVDSVGDVEAVRQALGVAHVGLVGVSYGTFLALSYARAHPQQVDHLVLDSSIPADGEPALGLNTVDAMRAELATMCQAACPGLDPLADLQTLLARLARNPVHFDDGYSRVTVTATLAAEIAYQALASSDLDPQLRATLPSALHLAAGGDIPVLGRLQTISLASGDSLVSRAARARRRQVTPQTEVETIATTCEDTRFPWASGDPLAARALKARAAFDAAPAGAFSPFDRKTVFGATAFEDCELWPEAGDAPPRVSGQFPSVPALLLSGLNDTRTPTADAAALAATLPGSTLVTVPNVGHSVLSTDHSGCARRALIALFGGQPVSQCPVTRPARVDPLPPASVASLPSAPVLGGLAGRVLTGAVLTLHHDVGFALPAVEIGGEIEGTHAGYLVLTGAGSRTSVVLHHVSYIPGLALRGPLNIGSSSPFALGTLHVRYRGRRFGTLTLTRSGAIRGRLGGRRFKLDYRLRRKILAAHGLLPAPGT